MSIVVTVPPTATPVTLEEAKEQCRLAADDNTQNTLIDRLLRTAVSDIEGATGALLSTQTVRLDLDGFPDGDIDLTTYPVASITSVKYDDANNVEQTMVAGTDYWSSLNGLYPKLSPVDPWPMTYYGKPNAVRITMVVGYSGAAPESLRHAILLRVEELFTGEDMSSAINALVFRHRRLKL